MDWQFTTLSAPGWTLFLGLVLTNPEQRDMAAIAAATKRFNELWTIVDKVLATRKFVAGDQLTIGGIPMGIVVYRWFSIKSYGTAWGGYVLLEVDAPDAFARYQLHHAMNYGHMAQITFEPLFDLDAALAPRVREMKT